MSVPRVGITSQSGMDWFVVLRALLLGVSTITLSVILISFNKVLMKPGHFPYAVPLAMMQMGFCTTGAASLLGLAPALFPALTDPEKKVNVDMRFVARGIAPIGVAYAANLVCANLAYKYLSVAFLQMMKETNLVIVYLLSLLASVERFANWHMQVIAVAIFSAMLTVRGELHFSLAGFVIQGSGQIFEGLRIVATSLLLSGKKLDALTCVLLLSPACFVALGCLLGISVALPQSAVPPAFMLPTTEKLYDFAPLLLLNCCIAFSLNVSSTLLIKYTSAVSYIFVGLLKDIVAVLVSVLVLHEEVSIIQCFAFCMQICAVLTWSLLKSSSPDIQERGVFGAFLAIYRGEWNAGGQSAPQGKGDKS